MADASLIERVGFALWGNRWKAGVARLIGISERQVARWAAAPDAIPVNRWRELSSLCSKRAEELQKLSVECDTRTVGR